MKYKVFFDSANIQINKQEVTRELISINHGKHITFILVDDNMLVRSSDAYVPWLGVDPQEEEFVSNLNFGKAYTKISESEIQDILAKQRQTRYSFNLTYQQQQDKNLSLKAYSEYRPIVNYNDYETRWLPFIFLPISFTVDGEQYSGEIAFKQTQVASDISIEGNKLNLKSDFYGYVRNWTTSLIEKKTEDYYGRYGRETHILCNILNHIKNSKKLNKITDEECKKIIHKYFALNLKDIPQKGIKLLENSKEIAPNLENLKLKHPELYLYYQWLHDDKTENKVTNNNLLVVFLKENGKNFDSLKESLDKSFKDFLSGNSHTRSLCLNLPGAKEKDEERREKHEWYLRKTNKEKAIGLGIDENLYPKLLQAVEEGNIPFNVFHNPGDQLELVNVEFDVWEKSLARPGWDKVIFEIASNASRRNTYDKRVTPYLSFLFKIEKYLNKHVPGETSWKAEPKYVDSQWELEMTEEEKEGTSKRRSALTPLVDNENRTITVPYAGLAISGRRTTYCYSAYYYVFEENFIDPEGGGVISKDLEEKLNGRDDYGLMYYTLEGSPSNQGYPTFLIIFENKSSGRFVHFHRVHPSRSKNGTPTPSCRLIDECYRYMAGNVFSKDINCQQGDLIFINAKEQEEELKAIKDFESHEFVDNDNEHTVCLIENKSKSIKNCLGFIFCQKDFKVKHPEHEMLSMKAGWYEVRRCRSFEANPVAIWSYTVD